MGQADVAIKIPFIFEEARERFTEESIGAAFWFAGVKMFNKMSAKPFNDCGIDHGGSKDP